MIIVSKQTDLPLFSRILETAGIDDLSIHGSVTSRSQNKSKLIWGVFAKKDVIYFRLSLKER